MSRPRIFLPWFENLNRAYQVALIALSFLAFFGTVITAGWTFWVTVMDYRIGLRVDPVADMVEYSLKASGQWDGYLQHRAEEERDRKVREPAQVSAGARPFWIFTN